MKFRSYEQHQTVMFPNNLEELIPKKHLVRVIDLVLEQLDLRSLYDSYSEEGQPGYHPLLLLKILIYGYSIGVRSSRKIGEKLLSDIFFMYLAGMQRPDFRTISDFRKNKKEYLIEYFKQVIQICKKMGLYSLGHVAIDGSKIEANASKKYLKEKEDIIKQEKKIEERIKKIIEDAEEIDESEDQQYGEDKTGNEIPDELVKENKLLEKIKEAKKYLEKNELKRVSITDPEAKLMRTADGGTDICYNVQAAVDSDNQIILAYKASEREDDHDNLIPIYEEAIRNTGEKPKEISADAGYHSGRTYKYLESNRIEAYLPDCKFNAETDGYSRELLGKYDRRNFIHNEKEDIYICPEGKELHFAGNSSRNKVKFKVYRCYDCLTCHQRNECISKPRAKNRQIQIYENDKFKAEMRSKLLSVEGRKKYLKRLATVEPVFANLKRIMNFRQFILKGKEKIECELSLLCTAYNIKKISKQLILGTI